MVGDVARIEDMSRADAEALAQTVVTRKAADGKIQADEILFALMTSSGRSDLATKLQVTGATACVIKVEAEIPAATVHAAAAPATTGTNPVAQQTGEAAVTDDKDTQRLTDILRATVTDNLQVSAEEVRVSFDTVSPMLDQDVPAGMRWQVRSLTRVLIGTVQWEAQLISKDHVVQKLTVQGRVLRRVQVVVSAKPIGKDEMLFNSSSVEVQDRWVDRVLPKDSQLAKAEEVIGCVAARSIPAGEVLNARSFRKQDLMVKGDAVTVWFVSGGMTIKGNARALESARLHDRVSCRGENNGETFEGTVIGHKIIVVGAVDAATESRLRKES